MRRVQFDPDKLEPGLRAEWDAWIAKARNATAAALSDHAAGREVAFDSRVWKHIKEWFFEHVFSGKCAYCEGETEIVSPGDGEHWRPKGAVSTVDGVRVARNGAVHPGYYWLAYDWHNLLPACERCNRGKGKGTRFPIAGDYVFSPDEAPTIDELDAVERPLLLHPFRGPDPIDHIDFDEFGQPVALTPAGEASIEVFNLARDPLNRARQKRRSRMEAVATTVFVEWLATRHEPGAVSLSQRIEAKINGDEDFSLATRVYLRQHVQATQREIAAEPV